MATAQLESVESQQPLPPEDRARADCYALISSLFYAPPSPQFLQAIISSDWLSSERDLSAMGAAWRGLRAAAEASDANALRQEYDATFIGTGRPAVFLYGSYYLAGFLNEKPLVKLRENLAALGIVRRPAVNEPEDHISALSEVMRLLIAGDETTAPAPLDAQIRFFNEHIKPWYGKLAEAVERSVSCEFYRWAGKFMRAFFEIEIEAFEIE